MSGEVVGEGDDDGIDCATERKKSSMYCRDAGSYWHIYEIGSVDGRFVFTYINWVDVTLMETTHVPIGQ